MKTNNYYRRYIKIQYKRCRKKTPFLNFILFGISLFMLLIFLYLLKFGKYGLSPDQGDWGTFGDFIGGTLNPVFAFLSLLALLTTIRLQNKELKASRQELSMTRDELSRSADAQKEQSNSIKIQNFENTFFNMLNLHNENINNIHLEKIEIYSPSKGKYVPSLYKVGDISLNRLRAKNTLNKKNALSKLLKIFLEYNTVDKDRKIEDSYYLFHKEYENIISHYFGQIYQVLKFIKESSPEKSKKRYIEIFRAQFSVDERELLFYHCLSEYGKKKFKPLIEEFEFLEHLPCKGSAIVHCIKYEKIVFGNNEEWRVCYNKMEEAKNE